MRRIDRHINDMTRLHTFSRDKRLLKNAICRKAFHIAGINDLEFKTKTVKNMFSISELLMSEIWNGNRLSVMRIKIKSELHSKAK